MIEVKIVKFLQSKKDQGDETYFAGIGNERRYLAKNWQVLGRVLIVSSVREYESS